MPDPISPQWRSRQLHLGVGAILTLLLGVLYYFLLRAPLTPVLSDPTAGSFPSLVHTFSLTWVAFALAGIKRGTKIAGGLLLLSLIAEANIGYADIGDAIMLLTGFVVAASTAAAYLRKLPAAQFRISTSMASGALMLCSTVFITGTSPYCSGCGIGPRAANASPVYMDYQTLRSSVAVSDPRPLGDISRVYVYQDSIFLNNQNNGIHVIDNRNPGNPQNIAFIEIPGNTEISIRSNYLYVDSYVDLVTLDISDPNNVREVNRSENIFPYDAYQNIPDDIYFDYLVLDESRGVVVSYVRN